MRKCEFCIHSYYNCKNELTVNLNMCNSTSCKFASKKMSRAKKNKEVKNDC